MFAFWVINPSLLLLYTPLKLFVTSIALSPLSILPLIRMCPLDTTIVLFAFGKYTPATTVPSAPSTCASIVFPTNSILELSFNASFFPAALKYINAWLPVVCLLRVLFVILKVELVDNIISALVNKRFFATLLSTISTWLFISISDDISNIEPVVTLFSFIVSLSLIISLPVADVWNIASPVTSLLCKSTLLLNTMLPVIALNIIEDLLFFITTL